MWQTIFENYAQLKGPATSFLRYGSLSIEGNAAALPPILSAFETALKAHLPPEQCTPKLASYLFFPFSQFLQLNPPDVLQAHQAIFGHILRLLGVLVARARDKLEKGIREQIWTFAALTLGGPLGSRSLPGTWEKQVRESAAGLLKAIIESDQASGQHSTNEDLLLARATSTGPFQRPIASPKPDLKYAPTESAHFELAIPPAIISHTLSSLLLLLETSEHTSRLSALSTLQALIEVRLVPSDEMPASLPGTVSTLCKAVLAIKGNTEVTVQALHCLQAAVAGCLNDERSRRFGLIAAVAETDDAGERPPAPTSLEDLFSGVTRPSMAEHARSVQSALSDITVTTVGDPSASVNGDPSSASQAVPGRSLAWLKATASQVHRAFVSLLPVLRSHSSASVRAALARLCGSWLVACSASIRTAGSNLPRLLQEELLVLSCDDWEEVSGAAAASLASMPTSCSQGYADIAREGLAGLAGAIFTHGLANEAALHRDLYILIGSTTRSGSELDARSLKMERWSRSLSKALEMVPVEPRASGNAQNNETSAPWLRANQSSLFLEAGSSRALITGSSQIPLQENGSPPNELLPLFPALRFANIASGKSVHLVSDALKAISSATSRGSDSLSLIQHFLALAGTPDHASMGSAQTASALWVAVQLISGLEGSISRHKERLVKDVVAIAQAWLEWELELEETDRASQGNAAIATNGALTSDALLHLEAEDEEDRAMEVHNGVFPNSEIVYNEEGRSSSALVAAQRARRPRSFAANIQCLALQLLGSASTLSGPTFRSQLMHLLYPMLRSLSPSSSSSGGLISASAYTAIQHISSNCGYSSPASLIVGNVDYILNSISARLRGASLGSGTGSGAGIDPLAPSVLVCTVDLAGEAVLPHLGDAVDEIFDALDRWHAYDLLVSELLRVLDVLVNACVKPGSEAVGGGRTKSQAVNQDMQKSLAAQPESERELTEFERWFKTRHDRRKQLEAEQEKQAADFKPVSLLPEANPHKPFSNFGKSKGTAEFEQLDGETADDAGDDGSSPTEEKEEAKASRSQVLVLSILRKCLHYVGHPSYFLRARVLALITTCIPLLSDRSSDLLPEVSKLWPYLLARLDDAQAASVHAKNSSQLPAYVTLECMRLIAALMEYKGDFMNLRIVRDVWPRLRKVLAKLQAPTAQARNTSDQFTTQHRMLRSAVTTMRIAVSTVPGLKNEDAWDIAMCFRRFCGKTWDPEIRDEASQLLRALGKVEADIVWLVLAAGVGTTKGFTCLMDSALGTEYVNELMQSIG